MRFAMAVVIGCVACGGAPAKTETASANSAQATPVGDDPSSPPVTPCEAARKRERQAVRDYLHAMEMFDGPELDHVVDEWMSEQSTDGFAASLRAEYEALAADGLTEPEDEALAAAVEASAEACHS